MTVSMVSPVSRHYILSSVTKEKLAALLQFSYYCLLKKKKKSDWLSLGQLTTRTDWQILGLGSHWRHKSYADGVWKRDSFQKRELSLYKSLLHVYKLYSGSHTVMVEVVVSLLSCVQLFVTMDCSLPGTSVLGILQTRILEWAAIPFSRRSFQARDWTQVYCIAGWFFTVWVNKEVPVI